MQATMSICVCWALQERVEPCGACCELLPRSAFSKSQWRRGANRTCPPCIERIQAAGVAGAVAHAEHEASLGLVDGKWHRVPRKQVRDRARRSRKVDGAAADAVLDNLKASFNLATDTVDSIAALGFDTESFERFRGMRHVASVNGVVMQGHERDFLTTVRSPPVAHLPFAASTSRSKDDVRPMGTFTDSPLMSRGLDLKFSCTDEIQHHVTSMPAESMVRHEGGTVLIREGVLHGARCSEQLPSEISTELVGCYREMERYREFLQRGKEVANVCGNFVVTGFKQDLNTKLYMTHHSKVPEVAFPELQVRLRLRRIFLRYVYPIVRREFGWLFQPVMEATSDFYACFVTGGRVFWPRSHTDPDLWYTVLVSLDFGKGVVAGGDFAFVTHGHVLQCAHGDVLVCNGLCLHGTTEFHLHEADASSGRLFFAFYMKAASVHAHARSQSLVSREGRSQLVLR